MQSRTWVSHHRIAEHLRGRIKTGTLKGGERLPSFEQLHRQFGVAPGTISKALGVLEIDGLVERRRRSGVYVTQARTVKRRLRIGIAGVRNPSMHTDYWTRMFSGAQVTANEIGAEATFFPNHDEIEWDRYNGLMAFGDHASDIKRSAPEGFPIVAIGETTFGVPSVSLNEFEAGHVATDHLIDLGHYRIGFFGWLDNVSAGLRLAGYHAAMSRVFDLNDRHLREYRKSFDLVGPAYDDRLVRSMGWPLEPPVPDASPRYGYMNMQQWLKDGFGKTGMTALIVHNDHFAKGVMDCLADHGYDVPGDISIVGFDNESEYSQSSPSLTSVGGDMFEVAAAGVRMLHAMIEGATGRDIRLPVECFARESTVPPASK